MFENTVDTNYVVALQYDPIHHWWGLHGITHDTNCKQLKQNKHIYRKSLPVIKASIFNVYSVHVLTPFSEHSYSSSCTRMHSKVCSSDVNSNNDTNKILRRTRIYFVLYWQVKWQVRNITQNVTSLVFKYLMYPHYWKVWQYGVVGWNKIFKSVSWNNSTTFSY